METLITSVLSIERVSSTALLLGVVFYFAYLHNKHLNKQSELLTKLIDKLDELETLIKSRAKRFRKGDDNDV